MLDFDNITIIYKDGRKERLDNVEGARRDGNDIVVRLRYDRHHGTPSEIHINVNDVESFEIER